MKKYKFWNWVTSGDSRNTVAMTAMYSIGATLTVNFRSAKSARFGHRQAEVFLSGWQHDGNIPTELDIVTEQQKFLSGRSFTLASRKITCCLILIDEIS